MRLGNKQIIWVKLGLITSLTLLLGACFSSENEQLTSYIKKIKLRKAREIEPIPSFSPLPEFSYPENDTRRNPFKSKIVKKKDALAPDMQRPRQPLEKYSLDALKFVGILKEGRFIWGLITLPDGEVTRVTLGGYMGKNYGKVIKISDNQIKLQELIKSAGKWEKQITTINLNTGQ